LPSSKKNEINKASGNDEKMSGNAVSAFVPQADLQNTPIALSLQTKGNTKDSKN
jgi:hypothetical protein